MLDGMVPYRRGSVIREHGLPVLDLLHEVLARVRYTWLGLQLRVRIGQRRAQPLEGLGSSSRRGFCFFSLGFHVCVYRGDRARAKQLISGREVQDLLAFHMQIGDKQASVSTH